MHLGITSKNKSDSQDMPENIMPYFSITREIRTEIVV